MPVLQARFWPPFGVANTADGSLVSRSCETIWCWLNTSEGTARTCAHQGESKRVGILSVGATSGRQRFLQMRASACVFAWVFVCNYVARVCDGWRVARVVRQLVHSLTRTPTHTHAAAPQVLFDSFVQPHARGGAAPTTLRRPPTTHRL